MIKHHVFLRLTDEEKRANCVNVEKLETTAVFKMLPNNEYDKWMIN